MPRVKLTKSAIDRAKPAAGRDTYVWDANAPGFGVRIKDSEKGGAKTFVVQYRVDGRSRRLTLGRYGKVTLAQARKLARQAFGEVAGGSDPAAERVAKRAGETVAELADRYLEQHARPRKKPSSVRMDEANLDNHVRPAFGRKRVADVTRADVSRLHHKMRETPGAANRVVALLSKMFNLAELWGLRPDGSNPCRHVQRYRERRIERYLSADELGRLGAALGEAEHSETEHPSAIAALRLLIFTGCRSGEVLGLKWEHVDIKRRVLRLPDSKTGAKAVPLNAPAEQVLAGLERSSEWVLPGAREGQHLVNLSKPWRRICQAAGITGLRIHDLRHSFASVGAGAGMSLHMIGKLLGHAQASTTQRYAHLSDDPLAEASEAIAARIAAAMDGREDAEVVELRK